MAQVAELIKGTVRASKVVIVNRDRYRDSGSSRCSLRQPDPWPVLEEHDTFQRKFMFEILV